MARIAGIDLPQQKQVWVGLTYIYGIGRTRSLDILEKAKVDAVTKVKDLTEDEAQKIRLVIQDEGRVEGDLRKAISLDGPWVDIEPASGAAAKGRIRVGRSAGFTCLETPPSCTSCGMNNQSVRERMSLRAAKLHGTT